MRTCQRRMAFQHVVASATSSDPWRHRAYLAKQRLNTALWQGRLTHDVLGREFLNEIRRGRQPSVGYLEASVKEIAANQLDFSRKRRYLEPGMTKAKAGRSYCVLAVHERGDDVSDAEFADVIGSAIGSLQFVVNNSSLMSLLLRGGSHQAEVTLRFPFAGWTIKGTPDLVFTDAKGATWIVDWKIGQSQSSDYSHQLGIYALAVIGSDQWPRATIDSLHLLEANLLQQRLIEHEVSASSLGDAEDFAYRGITELRTLLPSARYEDLDMNELDVSAKPTSCGFCSFADLCVEDLNRAGRDSHIEAVQGTFSWLA
jgi:hypothetical protein